MAGLWLGWYLDNWIDQKAWKNVADLNPGPRASRKFWASASCEMKKGAKVAGDFTIVGSPAKMGIFFHDQSWQKRHNLRDLNNNYIQ